MALPELRPSSAKIQRMKPARPRAAHDRDEGAPAPTSDRNQVFRVFAACTISARNQKNLKFFEMSGLKIFRKG